jgi:hypothetical protein
MTSGIVNKCFSKINVMLGIYMQVIRITHQNLGQDASQDVQMVEQTV